MESYVGSKEMEEKLQKIENALKQHRQTLCIAESCTGGLISHLVTNQPYCSEFFIGSLVSYSHSLKERFFQVQPYVLKNKGTVNKETALYMAKGVKSLLKGDWSLSITGLMGPSTDSSRQTIGQIFVGVCGPQGFGVSGKIISGRNRQERKYKSAFYSLNFLLMKLYEHKFANK